MLGLSKLTYIILIIPCISKYSAVLFFPPTQLIHLKCATISYATVLTDPFFEILPCKVIQPNMQND